MLEIISILRAIVLNNCPRDRKVITSEECKLSQNKGNFSFPRAMFCTAIAQELNPLWCVNVITLQSVFGEILAMGSVLCWPLKKGWCKETCRNVLPEF